MQTERREFFRIQTQLPCDLYPLPASAGLNDLYASVCSPPQQRVLSRGAEIDQHLRGLCSELRDRSVAAALTQLNEKYDLLLHALALPEPTQTLALELSAHGLSCPSAAVAHTSSPRLGVHVLLPDGYHTLGIIERQNDGIADGKVDGQAERIGGPFVALEQSTRQRLQRFLLRASRVHAVT